MIAETTSNAIQALALMPAELNNVAPMPFARPEITAFHANALQVMQEMLELHVTQVSVCTESEKGAKIDFA